ncbi:MAG: type IX secretion system membrane protein PorP/SprF [Saprospiraceae bacterium]
MGIKHYYIYICVFAFFYNNALSQDLHLSTTNIFDKYNVNKSYAGLTDNVIAGITARQQWSGLSKSPKAYTAFVHSPSLFYNGGYGSGMEYVERGIYKIFSFGISGNYVLPINTGMLSFGIAPYFDYISINKDNILTPEGYFLDNIYYFDDDYLQNSLVNSNININFKVFGLYIYKNIEFGIEFDKHNIYRKENTISGNYFLKLNYQYSKSLNPSMGIKGFGLMYYNFNKIQNDFGLSVSIINKYVGAVILRGIGKSSYESVSVVMGGNINSNMKLVYAYEIPISPLSSVESGTHEIQCIMNFGQSNSKTKLPPVIYNPRI